jgi:hypothetical protein
MVNLLQKIGIPVTAALTPLILDAGQVRAESIKEPSPTFPENPALVIKSNKQTTSLPPSSPTNPTPARKDIVTLSKANPFVTRPIEVSQGNGQPSNSPLVPPPDYGRSEAGAIADFKVA